MSRRLEKFPEICLPVRGEAQAGSEAQDVCKPEAQVCRFPVAQTCRGLEALVVVCSAAVRRGSASLSDILN
ncbi:hypothetical protein CgunFtcFv8_017138 [Champsocephalus gunnari]|uniref:Uncharacterized protein n=1 Tax=Champsocephalus gunnari TaxID=52237 RepID=A0AAN8HR36_CHAGU|nr:hypothetical protein CgunFtcFv8_017138 [Champsocephalus gunnari]